MRGICGVFEGKRRGPGQPPAGRKWRQAAGRERARLSAHGLTVHLTVIFQFFSLDNVSEPPKKMNCKEKDPEVGHTLAAKPTSPVRSQSSPTLAPLVRSPQPRCSSGRAGQGQLQRYRYTQHPGIETQNSAGTEKARFLFPIPVKSISCLNFFYNVPWNALTSLLILALHF